MFERFERRESASTTIGERPVGRGNDTTGLGALPGNADEQRHRKIDRAGYAS